MKLRPALHQTCAALGCFSLTAGSPVRAANLDWDPGISGGVTLGGDGSWTNTTPLN